MGERVSDYSLPRNFTERPELETVASKKQSDFFRIIFGDFEGYVCIAHKNVQKGLFGEEYFKYPQQLESLVTYIDKHTEGHEVWYCPMLFDKPHRKKENVVHTPTIWSDLDTCKPEHLLVPPTILTQTSPGKWQGLWCIDNEIEPSDAEAISKRIAYYHEKQGADRSGWDLTQLLRVPFTYNHKYSFDDPFQVSIAGTSERYTSLDLDVYPIVKDLIEIDLPFPEALPFENAEAALLNYRLNLPAAVFELHQTPPRGDWSKALFQLECLLFEAGLNPQEVFTIVRESACNKYKRDNRSEKLLWRDVLNARGKVGLRGAIEAPEVFDIPKLLTDEERATANADKTFIDEYVEWAKTLGDAAWQYHEASAFIILSSLLSGSVKLPTSFGLVTPNLWFMLLADTTLTRKTTAMDIAMELLAEVDPDCVLATDGSIEGLFQSLSLRPNRPSVFLRDEFTGLMEAITKKDYMAGMAETLTKLYDGKYQKRVLRKDIIELKDPILILFAGGIRSKMEQLLQFEHVSSGFVPRFIFVSATSSIEALRPLGPPEQRSVGERTRIIERLRQIHALANQQQLVEVNGVQMLTTPRFEAQLTAEAWVRYNTFETSMVEVGLKSTLPEALMPMMDRLSKSTLKASVLIAAARGFTKDITVTYDDLIKAISYTEKWREYSMTIVNNIGHSAQERQITLVQKAIERTPNILRSTIMRNFHLTKRDADIIFDTLEQRGVIQRVKQGGTEKLVPNKKGN